MVCILIYAPCFFAYEIKRMKPFANENILVQNKMGNNLFFIYFYSYFNLIANIISILILLPLNIIILLKFNKFIKNKSQNATRSTINRSHISTIMNQENNRNRTVLQENTKTETRFTRMIVSISFLFIFSRLCQASVAFFVIYNELIDLIKYFKFSYTILNIFGIIFTNLMFSINFLIFYFFNNTFAKKFDLIFCCKK